MKKLLCILVLAVLLVSCVGGFGLAGGPWGDPGSDSCSVVIPPEDNPV